MYNYITQTKFACAFIIIYCVFTWLYIKNPMTISKGIMCLLFASYVFVFAYLTLINRSGNRYALWLNPFAIIFKELKNGEFPYETLLNVLLCIPLGLTLPLTKKGISYKHVILVGLIVSLTTETLQLFTHRGDFETKDIIMNTLGTVIGYTIYRKILEKI